jgi:TPR repeat protein
MGKKCVLVGAVICLLGVGMSAGSALAQSQPASSDMRQYEVTNSAAIRGPTILDRLENNGNDPRQTALWHSTVTEVETETGKCRNAEAQACVRVSEIVLDDSKPLVLTGDSRETIAAGFLEIACALGNLDGCVKGAAVFASIEALSSDRARFGTILQGGCRVGAFASCSVYGAQFFEGTGGPADAATAVDFLDRGCRGGDIAVCPATAQMLTAGTDGVTADPARGALLYRAACDGGDAVSCYNLAMMQLRGRGIETDEPAGIANLQRAHVLDPELAPAAQALRRRGLLQ